MGNKTTGEEYLSHKHSSFRKSLLKFGKILIICMLIYDFIIKLYTVISNMGDNSIINIIIKFAILFVTEMLCLYLFNRSSGSDKLSNEMKNRLCCISLFGIFAIFQLLHYENSPLWMAPAVTMVISAMFGDIKTTSSIFAGSILSFIASVAMVCIGMGTYTMLNALNVITALAMIVCLFIMAILLIKFNVVQHQEIVDIYDSEQQLMEKVETEYLTGLFSRATIFEKLKLLMHEAYLFNDSTVAVAMIDIDFFKDVNDKYGHDKGDAVLKRLSYVIHEYTGERVMAGRYGGEEFVVVFSNYTRNECNKLLNGMLNNFRQQKYDFVLPGQQITFSAGFAMLNNYDFSPEEFIKEADIALYQSKKHGRNTVTEFQQNMLNEDK